MLPVPVRKDLTDRLTRLRARLPELPDRGPSTRPADSNLNTLLKACRDRTANWSQADRPPLRCLHQLACTGGTLIAQSIGAQPNTQLLSEVDPLSPIAHRHPFVPTDMIGLLRFASRPSGDDSQIRVFLAGLKAHYEETRHTATALILRDHAHSQFSYGPDIPERPTLHEILQGHYRLLSLVAVRHPVDSFLSLKKNGWVQFTPASFDEYCRRSLAFLDRHTGMSILRYEDFVADPTHHMKWVCELFELTYSSKFQHLHSAILISGDSGRSGREILPRPRRPMSQAFAEEAAQSAFYQKLCARLGYATDLEALPLTRAIGIRVSDPI